MNIKDTDFYKQKAQAYYFLIDNYYKLPTKTTIRGTFIRLTPPQYSLILELYNYCLEIEDEIELNNENYYIFNTVERLVKNSIVN